MARKLKPRLIPEQNRRLCGGICLCQLTVVLSCVALVYLTVAIYLPSHRAFNSGFEPVPVMCQVVSSKLQAKYCDWASCGEWCLTKTAGFCPQINVTVRQNGTDLLLEKCSFPDIISCPPMELQSLTRYNCNNGSECSELTGFFNCSLGHCANMTEKYNCVYNATTGPPVDSVNDNIKLNGFFDCKRSTCYKLKGNFKCDRYCNKIPTRDVSVLLLYEDSVYVTNCKRALALNAANGSEEGSVVTPTEIWNNSNVLVASCHSVYKDKEKARAKDCINGTILEYSQLPKNYTNFTTLWNLYENSNRLVDPTHRYLPYRDKLAIYNNSKLYINLEACVNTLRGECKEFYKTHGRGGENHTAYSRFPCFYRKDDGTFAIARFDLKKTWRELIIATTVPSSLFILSITTLCIITKSVEVGDDSRMRCKCCAGEEEDSLCDNNIEE